MRNVQGFVRGKFSGEFFTEEMSSVECPGGIIVRGGPYPHIGLQVSMCSGCDLGTQTDRETDREQF